LDGATVSIDVNKTDNGLDFVVANRETPTPSKPVTKDEKILKIEEPE
jgi:hypothetical protein